jgi:hypothetical protein
MSEFGKEFGSEFGRGPAEQGQALLIMTISPGLEDALVDWLLERPESPEFNSVPVHGHGSSHQVLSPVEQVTGRQRRIQFQVSLALSQVDTFLDSASLEFGKADVHYWVLPLTAAGALADRR